MPHGKKITGLPAGREDGQPLRGGDAVDRPCAGVRCTDAAAAVGGLPRPAESIATAEATERNPKGSFQTLRL